MINLFYIYTLYIIVAFGLKKLSLFQFMGPPIPFPTSTVGKPVSIPSPRLHPPEIQPNPTQPNALPRPKPPKNSKSLERIKFLVHICMGPLFHILF